MAEEAARIEAGDAERFERDGVVCLRGVLSRRWVERLQAASDRAMAQPGPYHQVQSAVEDPGHFFTEYYLSRRISTFHRFVQESPLAPIAARLMGSPTVRFFFDGLFVKEPGTRKVSQWHQDQPYYPVAGRQVLVAWVALDPMAADCSLQVVRRSHRSGHWYQPVLFRNNHAVAGNEDAFEPMPDIDRHREDYDIASFALEPGDCVCFHALAIHGAPGNAAAGRRRALATTWLGEDTRFASRQGRLEPHFAHLEYREGEPLHDERVFPRVWPRGVETGGD